MISYMQRNKDYPRGTKECLEYYQPVTSFLSGNLKMCLFKNLKMCGHIELCSKKVDA